ncbi:uncharacterized protein BXZ73DRAFT_49348, partial [Epithele typhae]|uniref:uncharacterized protein n=1 Tax=Epithele typhae TaxID=378194 RepID=UPI002007DE4F
MRLSACLTSEYRSSSLSPIKSIYARPSTTALLFLLAMAPGINCDTTALSVETPSDAVQCQLTTLVWSGGQADYTLHFATNADLSESISPITSTTFNWRANVPAGAQVVLTVTDGTGLNASSDAFVIQDSADTSC